MNEDVEEREEEFRSNGNINDYVILKPIGKGKFATVYRAKRVADQRPVALKKIHAFEELDEKKRVKCLKEVRLLQSLQHRHIISYMDSFVCDGSLVIVSEWAEAGDLKRQIRKLRQKGARFHEHVIWKYFLQIAEALKHMHSRRVMHRDLKPANIFLTAEADVKVGDLGLGRHFSDETMEAFSKVGTPLYMSPEVLKGKGYGWKSDIWSLGCILYELATLRSPFKEPGLNLYGLFKKIGKGEFEPIPKMFSNDIRQLCNRMISLDVRNRPDADEVCKLAREMCEKTAKDLEDVKQRRASAKEAAIRATAKTSGGSMEIVLGRLSLLRYQERVLLRNHFLGPLLLSPCGRRAKNDGGSVGTMGPHHWSMQFANFVCVVQFLLEHLGEKLLEVADIDAIRKLMSELGDMDFRRHRWDHSRMTVGMRVLLALGRVGFSKDEIMARALTPQSLMYVLICSLS
jgi:tRNA A-37 threonylcarbamoyl transferase component Bud32